MMKHSPEYPYAECASCRTLMDCVHPDVTTDGLGSPMPPEVCPRPIDVMKETYKQRKDIKEGLKPTRDDLS